MMSFTAVGVVAGNFDDEYRMQPCGVMSRSIFSSEKFGLFLNARSRIIVEFFRNHLKFFLKLAETEKPGLRD